jgi:hypothetical protein
MGESGDLKALLKVGGCGIEALRHDGARDTHETGARPRGVQKEGTKDNRKIAGLRDNSQSNSTSSAN